LLKRGERAQVQSVAADVKSGAFKIAIPGAALMPPPATHQRAALFHTSSD
jgi:hypothetical protein